MVGENPLLLAATHAGPAADGVEGIGAVEGVVADDAAEQTVVGGGYPVVAVKVDGGQSRHVEAEFQLVGNLGGELGVEAVDALNKQD